MKGILSRNCLLLLAAPLAFVIGGAPVQVFAAEPPSTATPVIVSADEAPWLTYDAGKLRILAPAEGSGGRYSVLELDELPGYKTPVHMHPGMDETFYVLEGVLELRLSGGKTYRLGAGSYAHVPRDTPHAQGSADDNPVRVLVTFSPGQFEEFFLDRVALIARTPRSHPDFRRLYLEIVQKHSKWLRPASLEASTNE